jgi:hypothetical protein
MHIRSLTREDLPQLKEITFETFKNDAMYSYLQPKLKDYPDDFRRVAMIRFRTRIVSVGQHGFVAVTDEGDSSWNGRPEVAGVAFVVRYGDDEDAKRWQADPLFKSTSHHIYPRAALVHCTHAHGRRIGTQTPRMAHVV